MSGFPKPCPRCLIRVNCEAGAQGGIRGGEYNCCECVPKRLKIQAWDNGSVDVGDPISCRTANVNCDSAKWDVLLSINNEGYAFSVYFEMDSDGVCWFYLESPTLGLMEDAEGDYRKRVVVPGGYPTQRTERIAFCVNPEATFTDVYIPGYGYVTITTSIADYQEINPSRLKRCTADCTDTGISCWDCNCFCRCVCVTYSDDEIVSTQRVCWDTVTEAWNVTFGSVSFSIGIACNTATGESQLAINDPWSGDVKWVKANCPEVAGSFNLTKQPGSILAGLSIRCDTCGKCTSVNVVPCGCGGPLPPVIYASFSPQDSPGPPEPYPKKCHGALGVIPLIWFEDNGIEGWFGVGQPFTGCSTRIYMKVVCQSPGVLFAEWGTSWDTLGTVGSGLFTFLCDPFEATITDLTWVVATDLCCNSTADAGTANYNIFKITLTE